MIMISGHRIGSLIIIIAIIITLLLPVLCKEVAYSFSDSGEHPLPMGNVTEYNGSDIVTSAINSASIDAESVPAESITVDEVKKEINLKLNVGNQAVKDKGRSLTVEYSGDRTIRQICSVYDYMVGNWSYIPDTRGIEEFQYSNKSLEYGIGKFSGQGDCDDFSILLASLIESIGGTSRIILAYGPMGGHAYTEVYLGKAEGTDNDADRMIKWLRAHYSVPEINAHTDLDTREVWLNLDWWKDPNTNTELARHPGGPFFKATNQTPIPIREKVAKVPLKPLNDLPIAQFTVSPTAPNEDEAVTFDASSSRDIGIGGEIKRYLWNYGDGGDGEGRVASHIYLQGAAYLANLTVIDNDGAKNGATQAVVVNALPVPVIDYEPKDPMAGNKVYLDATKSWDNEDGKVSRCLWEFGDEGTSKKSKVSHSYDEPGNYLINLTVYDKDNAGNKTSLALKINEPPVAKFAYSTDSARRYQSEGESITFDASESDDKDGNITKYQWNFGDGSLPIDGKVVAYSYATGGNFTVRLEITDNNNATAVESKTLRINWLPIARISPIGLSHAPKEDIIFDASNSSDIESNMLKYSWDFNNDNIIDSGAKRDAYNYRLSGQYTAKLTVTDENGALNSSFITMTIKEPDYEPSFKSITANESIAANNSMPQKEPVQEMRPNRDFVGDAADLSDKGAKLCVLGRYDEAINYSERAIVADSSNENAWFNMAIALIMKENFDDAINASDIALELNMSDVEASSNKGRALTGAHSPEKAITWYDMAIDINPNLAEAWFGKADALFDMGGYDEAIFDEAIGCYDKAIEINGSSRKLKAEVLYEKARSSYYQGTKKNDTALIDSSYDIYKNAVEMGYILGYTDDDSPFGLRAFKISWKSLVHPRMSTWDKTRELRRLA